MDHLRYRGDSSKPAGEAVDMQYDSREFEAIYRRHHPAIVLHLSRFVGLNEAEDLAQEVFVKVNRGLRDFRGASQVSTWIYRIATNAAPGPGFGRTWKRIASSIATSATSSHAIGKRTPSLRCGDLLPLYPFFALLRP